MKKRNLTNFTQIEEFLDEIEFPITESNYNTVSSIAGTELSLKNIKKEQCTLDSDLYKNKFYRSKEKRQEIRNSINTELISLERIDSDDDIKLGQGGALPKGKEFLQESKAFLVIGLPASGKSSISNKIADQYKAIILDSDYAKRKLPEFSQIPFGASLVHDESADIIFGTETKAKTLFDACLQTGANIVIPKIGSSVDSILAFIEILESCKYQIHIILVKLPRNKATGRAIKRFIKHNRYVPVSLIYDVYGENPSITYDKLKSTYSEKIESFLSISTDVEKGADPIVIEMHKNTPYSSSLFDLKI